MVRVGPAAAIAPQMGRVDPYQVQLFLRRVMHIAPGAPVSLSSNPPWAAVRSGPRAGSRGGIRRAGLCSLIRARVPILLR